MAAPFRTRLSSRFISKVVDTFSSTKSNRVPGACNQILLTAQKRFYVSKNWGMGWRFRTKTRLILLGGLGVAAATGFATLGGLALDNWKSLKVYAEDQERPHCTPSRQIRVETDNSGLKLTLYQYQTCPFCCKVRAWLDYHGFSYDVIEVNSVTKKQLKWSEYPKVPILIVEFPSTSGASQEVKLQDSSVIISVLESYLHDRTTSLAKYNSYYPCMIEKVGRKTVYDYPNKYFVMFQETADLVTTPKERNEERKWRRWADNNLVHMLSPNAYRTMGEALQAFNYFSDVGQWEQNFSYMERKVVIYCGAAVMYILGKILKSRYNLKDDVRESLYDSCNEWVRALGKNRPFMGGNQPNLADLAVFGVLHSIEGCIAFQDVLSRTKIGPWYNRTKTAIQNHQGSHPHFTKGLPSDIPKKPVKQ